MRVFGGTPGVLDLNPGDRGCRKCTMFPRRRSEFAAAISTRMAWSGHRCRVATSAALIAASAKARSMGRTPPAIIARRAGRSISIPAPVSKASARTALSSSYYTWVDQHNTSGLGEDIPISTANLGDGFVALKDGKMITIRISLSAQLLRQGLGWADRRSERRLERPRIVEHERRPRALAQGRRQRLNAPRRAHPVSARSPGELRFAEQFERSAGQDCGALRQFASIHRSHFPRFAACRIHGPSLPMSHARCTSDAS